MGTVTERQVAHIWRRLGFGATGADIDHGVRIGPTALINELLRRRATTPAQWKLPTLSSWEDQAPYLGRQLELMATSPNPLQERLAWILQGTVVIGISDFVSFDDLRGHLTRLRVNPFGSYTQLLRDTAVLPGMMKYLNGFQNSADHPNQNYARELMELFSLGIKNLVTGAHNYTQDDVIQVARALTGYTYDWSTGKIVFDPSSFDSGQKHFFGANQGDADHGGRHHRGVQTPLLPVLHPGTALSRARRARPRCRHAQIARDALGQHGRRPVGGQRDRALPRVPSASVDRHPSEVTGRAARQRCAGHAFLAWIVGLRLAAELVHEPTPLLPAKRLGVAGRCDVAERRGRYDVGCDRPGLRRRVRDLADWRRGHAATDGHARHRALEGGPTLRHHGPHDVDGARTARVHDERNVGPHPCGGHVGARSCLSRVLGQLGGVDMTLTRRSFLAQGGLVTVTVAGARVGLDLFSPLGATAGAATLKSLGPLPAGTPILVLIDLQGGNDATNMVIDPTDPWYYDVDQGHGAIAIQEAQILPLSGVSHGLHPSMPWLASRWTNSHDVAFVLGTGENVVHEFSHFAAGHYRQVADFTGSVGTGWLGRFNDLAAAGSPFASVSIDGVHPTLVGTKTPVLSVPQVQYFDFNVDWRWEDGWLSAWQAMGGGGAARGTMTRSSEIAIADTFTAQSKVFAASDDAVAAKFDSL